jgi:peptidoglycan-N-acetylglucosamine deacetylase
MKFFLAVVFCALFLSGCTKMSIKGNLPQPAIALTFDDSYVDDWHKMIPLLDSFNAKATFYVSNYNWFGATQKKKLKDLQAHGHEIAFHTTNHYNLDEYMKNCKMDVLLKKEIWDGLEKMKADGYNCRTFAYPYGQHNELLDKKLLQQFKSVRALNGTNNYARSMATGTKNRMLYGLGIDESSKRPFDVILKLIQNAANDKTCLVLTAHHVGRPELKMQLPMEKLRKILEEASRTGVKCVTVSEISAD